MLFNSYTFIFLFLPFVWISYWFARGHSRDAGILVLCMASMFFYAYWDFRFLPLLLFSIGTNHLLSRAIYRPAHSTAQLSARIWLIAGIVFNLGLLAFFKYMNFFSEVSESLTGTPLLSFRILLPIGISFFTFQQITFLVDSFRGNAPRYSLLHYLLFVSFFPQLIAGPIVHHSEMMPQFAKSGRPAAMSVAMGLSIFTAGLFKKLVLADNIAPFASAVFVASDAGLDVTFVETWVALIAFSFQMYFDFSGYCDMAIGLALMFGVRLPVNFFSPYKARSIREYWRRWNITLGRFLIDYIYIPLGGSRGGELRTLINLMILMFVSGMWHGAGWGFILWGILNGFWLWLNTGMSKLNGALGRKEKSIIPERLACVMTFAAVSFGWCFFKSTNLAGAMKLAGTAVGLNGLTIPDRFAPEFSRLVPVVEAIGFSFAGPNHVAIGEWATVAAPMIVISFLIVWAAPNTNEIFLSADPEFNIKPPSILTWRPNVLAFTSVAVLFFCSMIFASSISEFLYFQF